MKRYTSIQDRLALDGRVRRHARRDLHALQYGLWPGEVDLKGIMQILKKRNYKGWINLDRHYFRVSAQGSLNRCMAYVRKELAPIDS